MSLILNESIQAKIGYIPESSMGAQNVTLVLKNGSRVPNVTVAWGRVIVGIDGSRVDKETDLEFKAEDVVDVLPR